MSLLRVPSILTPRFRHLSAAMLMRNTASGPGAPSDIATLVTALGGDSVVAGIWDARYNVTTSSGNVVCVEDARQTTLTGRYYFPAASAGAIDCGRCTAFDGLTKCTWIVWMYRYPADGTLVAVSKGSASSPFKLAFVGTQLKLFDGSGNNGAASVDGVSGGYFNGDLLKYAITYDGTQTAGARFKAYLDFGDGSSCASTSTLFDNLGSSMATSTTENLQIGCWGGSGIVTDPLWGCIEELRMYTGVALTSTQINAETLGSAPSTPNFRYTFDGNANNTGSTSGNDGTVNAAIISVGHNAAYGAPLGAYTPNGLPTYDGTNHKVTFSSSSNGNALTAGQVGTSIEQGTSIVAVEPTGSSGFPTLCSYFRGTASGDEFLTTFRNGSNVGIWSAALGPTVGIASLTRVIHSRRAGTGGTKTCGLQDGTGSEATNTSSSFTTSVPHLIRVGAAPTANPSDIVWRALIVLVGTVTSGQRSTINTWAAANHGATV